MALFTIKAPDGRRIKVRAADEATALRGAQEYVAANPRQASQGEQMRDYIKQNGIPGQGQLAFAAKGIESLPIVGAPIKAGLEWGRGKIAEGVESLGKTTGLYDYNAPSAEDMNAFTEAAVKGAPVEAAAGEIFGNVAPLAVAGIPALGGKLLGMTGSLASRTGFGAASGAAIGGADALVDSGGDLGKGGTNAIIGALLAGGLPLAGKGIQVLGAGARQAMKPAVTEGTSEGIKTVSGALFRAAEDSKASVPAPVLDEWLTGLTAELRSQRMTGGLDEVAEAAFTELKAYGDDLIRAGQANLGDLHIMRQIAQRAAQSSKGRDTLFGTTMVKWIDGLIASTGDDTLKGGINSWARGSRAELVEGAIERARLAATGFENGLKVELRKIVFSKQLSQGFTRQELDMMKQIVKGTFTGNVMAALGKLGLGGNRIAGPFLASVVGGPAGMLAATGARRVSEQASENAGQRLLDTVAGTPSTPRGLEAIIDAMAQKKRLPMKKNWSQAAGPMIADQSNR